MKKELLYKPEIRFLLDSGVSLYALNDCARYAIEKIGNIVSEIVERNCDIWAHLIVVIKVNNMYIQFNDIVGDPSYMEDIISNDEILESLKFVEPYEKTVIAYK